MHTGARERPSAVRRETLRQMVALDEELGLYDDALAAGSRRAKTPKAVECEASQSGGDSRNAQPQSSRK